MVSATAESEWVRREYETLNDKRTTGRRSVCPRAQDNSSCQRLPETEYFSTSVHTRTVRKNGGELLRLLHSMTGKPLSPEAAHFAAQQDAIAKEQAEEIARLSENKEPELLLELFNTGGLAWETSSALGCKAAEA